MEIDQTIAAALGFPKPEYTAIELERRWLCDEVPRSLFQGDLAGLILAEAEFKSLDALAAFPMPSFAAREVTDELGYTGGFSAIHGLPR